MTLPTELTYTGVLLAVLANQLCLPVPTIVFLMAAQGDYGCLGRILRLARCTGDRQAGDVHQVAADSLSDILAMEVASPRPPAAAEQSQSTNP